MRVVSGLEHAPAAHELIADTFRRSAMPFMDEKAFHRMIRGLGEYVRVFAALRGGDLQGCAVIPFSRYRAYYAYGGTAPSPVTGASNLLQWEVIRYFHAMGTQSYDFCGARVDPDPGSKAAGLVMYKERFGGELLKGYMWKSSLRPLKAAFYHLGVRFLRGGDIVDQERRRLAKRRGDVSLGTSQRS
ncbi:MAG: GNAT family N-acetyltransferase [Verrucomicrobia bacterium]|nr:GNAT family N-acetyltransferase [Verrucomicrobiota bacterium]